MFWKTNPLSNGQQHDSPVVSGPTLEYEYDEHFLSNYECRALWENIINSDSLIQRQGAYGNREPRLTAFFAQPEVTYRYSRKRFTGTGIPVWLQPYFEKVNRRVGYTHNFVLINLYRDGKDYMPPHADDEPEIGPDADNRVISSITLLQAPEQPRLFRFRSQLTKQIVPHSQLYLAHGSLLIMKGQTQNHFLHEMPKTNKKVAPRINLTFRVIVGEKSGREYSFSV